jgi:arylsulfatase
VLVLVALCTAVALMATPAAAQPKPNIVIIWGDDIGQSNISAYSHGLMGYKTPNIDRVAREGMMFTDYTTRTTGAARRSRRR